MIRKFALSAAVALASMMPAVLTAEETASDVEVIEMQQGNPDASVTVIEYASYTCPHCASFHANQYLDLKADYIDTGKINFIYREVYFDRYGLWASLVARCGGAEKFFGVSELIYAGQKDWTHGSPVEIVASLRKIGKVAGLTDESMDACLSDADKAKALFAWYQEHAERDDISGTPSFIVNGEKHGNLSSEEFAELLDAKLAE